MRYPAVWRTGEILNGWYSVNWRENNVTRMFAALPDLLAGGFFFIGWGTLGLAQLVGRCERN